MTSQTVSVSDHARRTARRVARLVTEADALLITAGAGMSVDSGLPDFRNLRRAWNDFPPLASLGLAFEQLAQPPWFDEMPEMAWAWYGHRQQAYREARPHDGYRMLRAWTQAVPCGSFVVTSNVDGQFHTAGYTDWQVVERHGSVHRYQCSVPCSDRVWNAAGRGLDIDTEALRVNGGLPHCPHCGALARPNVLLFNDTRWVDARRREQQRIYDEWLASLRGKRLVIVECGAGAGPASVRRIGERLLERSRVSLVRINPEATEADEPMFVLRMPARQAIALIHASLPTVFGGPDAADFHLTRPEFGEVATPITLRLEPVTCIDLARGLVTPFDGSGIGFDEEIAFMERYGEAQSRWVPVPEVRGLSAPGYSMRAAIIRSPDDEPGATAGAAIVFVQAPDEQAVMTFGIARCAAAAPFLWQLLYETADTRLAALDFPRAPWVARRPAARLAHHPDVRPYLVEFERMLVWSYLRYLAFIDATQRKDPGPAGGT